MTDCTHERNLSKLRKDFGEVFRAALADSETVEIVLNSDGSLWHERLGEPLREQRRCSHSDIGVVPSYDRHPGESLHRVRVAVGRFPVRRANSPLVSSPVFAVRKRASRVFTLEQYVEAGIITPEQKEFLCEAVKNHRNVLITGSTGSGKSTLLNGIIHELTDQFPNERLVIIEDTAEIQCSAKDYVQYHHESRTFDDAVGTDVASDAAGPNTCRRSKGAGGARSPDVLEYRTRGRDRDTARQQFRGGPDQAVHFGEHAFRCSQGH